MPPSEAGLTAHSYYEATAERPASAPPLMGRIAADVAIVGGGYAGLSAALELGSRGYSVALLEARRIGWGASGRNGGQVLVGFAGLDAIERQLGKADARRCWDMSIEGVRLVGERIARFGIDCDHQRGHLTLATKPRRGAELARLVEHLAKDYGYELQLVPHAQIGDWIASPRFHSGAFDGFSGHLHPLKYCLGLARAAQQTGTRLYENTSALRIEHGIKATVKTEQGEVSCDFVVLAGNVYLNDFGDISRDLAHRIVRIGTFMVATDPVDDEVNTGELIRHRASAFDNNLLLDYFRVSADERLLFGGADVFRGPPPADIAEHLRSRIGQVFPQLKHVPIAYAWGGFVDASINGAPDFGRIGPQVYYLQGFSGHGVALSGLAGKLVAEAIAGQSERLDVFAQLKHMRFPRFKRVRDAAVGLAAFYYRLHDRML